MHPSRDDLHSLLLGTLVEDQADSLVHHIDGCSHCEQVMLELEDESDEFLHDLKQSPGDDPFEQESDCRQLVSVVKAIGREASVSSQRQAESAAEHDLGKIGQYKLLAKLGEGGMGAVYKALHTRLRRVVALKVLPADRIQDQAALARFDREMQAVGQLNHPNIVAAHDAGEADGMHYLVMELVEGYDLSKLVKRLGPLDAADACELIRQSAVGLEHAHQRSMVHRDIKPSNIMLARTEDGAPVVKLLDMGLALLDDPHTPGGELTSTGQMMGTLDYMSPEQGTDTHNVDIRADIYSLGATLFKLLCGEAPFSADEYNTPGKMLIALATKTPPSIGEKRQGLPAELVAVVDRMLAKERDDRPATPQQLAELLTPFTDGADLRALLDAASVDRDAETKVDQSAAATHESLKSESAETAPTVSAPVPSKEGDRSAGGQPAIEPTNIVTVENPSAGSTDSVNVQPWQSEQTKAKPAPSGPARRPKTADRRKLPRWANRRNQVVAAAALAGVVLLCGVIFYIKTNHGTIVVEVKDPSISVTVQGEDIHITKNDSGEPYKIKPGEHTLHVKHGDLEFDTEEFMLRRGEEVVLTVQLIEGELQVRRKDEMQNVIGQGRVKAGGDYDGRSDGSPKTPPDTASPNGREEMPSWQPVALTTHPAPIVGVRQWTIETRYPRGQNNAVAVHPQGELFAVAAQDAAIRLWNPNTGELHGILMGHTHEINDLTWSSDGKRIASCSFDHTVRQWDVESNQAINVFHIKSPYGPIAVDYSPDGRLLAVLNSNETQMLDAGTGENVKSLPCRASGGALAFSPNGEQLAIAAGGTKKARIFDVATGEILHSVDELASNARCVTWSPNGKSLLVAAGDIYFWDATTGEIRTQFAARVFVGAYWSSDRKTVYGLGLRGGPMRAFDVVNPERSRLLPGLANAYEMEQLSGNRWVAKKDSHFEVWEMEKEKVERTWENVRSYGRSVSTSPDGRLAAVGTRYDVLIMDAATGKLTARVDSVCDSPLVGWSPKGNWLAIRDSHSPPWNVWLWQPGLTTNGSELPMVKNALSFAWSPDGSQLATSFADPDQPGVVRIWDVKGQAKDPQLQLKSEFPAHDEGFVGMDFSPDGRRLATTSRDKTTRVFEIETGRELHRFEHGSFTKEPHWSPDGQRLAYTQWHAGSTPSNCYLVDITNGQMPKTAGAGTRAIGWLPENRGLLLSTPDGIRRMVGDELLPPVTDLRGSASVSLDGRFVFFRSSSKGLIRVVQSDDFKDVGSYLILRDEGIVAALSADGHWRGPDNLSDELVYVAETESGQQISLSPADFEKQFGWKNEPEKVNLVD